MIAVILAGGLGTRMGTETAFRPKPMVEIGQEPTLWHLIRFLEEYGFDQFLIAGGYRIEVIQEYFRSNHGFRKGTTFEVVNTGASTPTGGRLLALQPFLRGHHNFLCTYGDGLSDINIDELLKFHNRHGKIATVTGVRPRSRFGVLERISDSGQVKSFQEKPLEAHYVNGGFFLFNQGIFNYLSPDSTLESSPIETLVQDGEIYCFKHGGFWKSMDTYRENRELHKMWTEERAPWKNW